MSSKKMKALIILISCLLLFHEVNCEESADQLESGQDQTHFSSTSTEEYDREGESSNEDNNENVNAGEVLPTSIGPLEATSEKEPEIASKSTTASTEASSSTENASSSVLEATEGATEGSEQMSSKILTSTTQTPLVTELTKEKPPEQTFAVWEKEKICLLAKFHAVFTITYPSKGGEQSVSVELPSNINSEGECGDESKSPFLQLSWDVFGLTVTFSKLSKEEGPDEWAMTGLELRYDTSSSLFDGATKIGKKTAQSKDIELFKTEYGRSFYCPATQIVSLYRSNKKVASVKMKEIHIQPFEVKDGKFSKAQRCNDVVIHGPDEPFVQDETVPLAVGLTLTILTLIVVLGFSIHRAYTMRKVDYNSME